MQRLADLAAIDAARVRSQCLGEAGFDEVTAEVAASLRRNRMPTGITVVTGLGMRREGEDGLVFFEAAGSSDVPDSVQVTLSRASPARILPLFAGEQSRTLTSRAAARSSWVASAHVGPANDSSADGNFRPAFYGGALRANIGLDGNGFASGATASLTVSDFINVNQDISVPLPDMDVPTPVLGLLSTIEALLNQSGDTAAAAAVNAFADAVAAGRPGSTVIPAEILGLPAQGAYDGATATVGEILNAIAGAVSNGDPIQLPNLCALLPLEALGAIQALPALCDSTITARIPQGSRPGSFNSSTQILDVSDGEDGGANSAAGLVEVRLKLVNPINGERFELPALVLVEKSKASVTALTCARLGQSQNVATVSAYGPRMSFGVGNSSTFTSPGGDLSNALNDLEPVRIISTSVQDLLTTAGLGGGLLGNPLNLAFLGQPVTISVRAGPVTLGDTRTETFCMQGPPFGGSEQCNGAPAAVGGATTEEAAELLADGLGDVQIDVQLPSGLPPLLNTAVQGAATTVEQLLATQLQGALRLVAAQLVPVLQSASLAVGESSVYLDSATVTQPEIYAQ